MLFSEHADTYASSSSPHIVVQTMALSRHGELAIPSLITSQREGKDVMSSIPPAHLDHNPDVCTISPTTPKLAAPVPGAPPLDYHVIRQVSSSIPNNQHGREPFVQRPPKFHSPQVHRITHGHMPKVNDRSDVNGSVPCDGAPPAHSASPGLTPFSPESVNVHSPELSSRPAAPEGQTTRIEIAFEMLHQGLLCSRYHESLIQEVAQ